MAASAPTDRLADWFDRQPDNSPLRPLLDAMRDCADAAPPTAVATLDVLEQLRADSEVQVAALLHLHPPLLAAAKAALAKAPGVRGLLDGLEAAEQVAILHARRDNSSGTEGLRRLLLALIRDLRVVLILLSRQLVRMREAGKKPEPERRALAALTHDIHAPLANRLGIWQLKWELEDLSFRYLHPETYQRIARLLDEKRAGRERFVEEAKQRLRELLAEHDIDADVAGRPKHIYSIWKKMQRKHLEFHELYDVRAIRVLVDDVAECYAALGLVHQHWTPIPAEFDDYIAKPKGNDYRSLHTAVIGADGRPFEVQIRTRAMHEHAELGVAAHWRYKEGGQAGKKQAEVSFERKVSWMRQLLEGRGGEDEGELLAGFNTELLEDRKYLLTPRGEVIDLPHEGTVLDFAYHVHTEVGHRCRGAKVNGRIVPLDYRPNSGDQVEILTSKTGEPRRDWLIAANGFLASGRARDKVRSWFHKLDRERNVAAGREILEKELRRVAMMQADLAPVLEKFRLESLDSLHEALALGDVGPSQVSRTLHDHAQAQAASAAPVKVPEKTTRPSSRGEGGNFTVEGVGNLLTQLARCCQPVPGDAISGYLTRGRGVSIHRVDCAALQRLLARDPDRELPVNWAAAGSSRYEVGVQIHAYDRKWLLKDLTNVLAQSDATIVAIQSSVDSARGLADVRVTLRVGDFGQLSQLLGRLDAVPGVQDARRLG